VPDAVYYAYYNGQDWLSPVDVLVSPDQQSVSVGELVMLPDDGLALLWIGAGELQLSRVAVENAQRANAWQTTPLFSGLASSSAYMAFSPPTTLYVVLVGRAYDVLFAQSSDLGNSWTEPSVVWTPANDGHAADDVRLCLDESGQVLHLVWHENARELGWNPNGVWYTRSEDRGASWENALFLPNHGSSPNCAYDGDGKLHMLWNNAVGSTDGRYHTWSEDDGLTWSEPRAIFPGLSGRTRAPALGIDSLGTLHVLTGAYSERKTQMFWSYWQGDRWATPQPISGDLVSNESPDLVVTNGNQLNAVWHFGSEDSSDIWFSTLHTDAPALPTGEAQVQMQPELTATLTPLPPTQSKATITSTSPSQVPVTVTDKVIEVAKRNPVVDNPQKEPLLPAFAYGALAGFGIVLGTVFVALYRRPR